MTQFMKLLLAGTITGMVIPTATIEMVSPARDAAYAQKRD